MAKVNKYINEYVVQENAGYGWCDACTEATYSDARKQAKVYRDNGYNARTITRRVINPKWSELNGMV
jgi:hypothetical protein